MDIIKAAEIKNKYFLYFDHIIMKLKDRAKNTTCRSFSKNLNENPVCKKSKTGEINIKIIRNFKSLILIFIFFPKHKDNQH